MFQSSILKTNVEIWTTLSSMSQREIKENDDDWMEALEAFVIANWQNSDLTNEQIADHLNISVAQFYRRINKYLGVSPNQYIRDIRLRIAYEVLNTEEIATVKEVAYKVGFTRVDYFSKIFEKKYGVRPKKLLKH